MGTTVKSVHTPDAAPDAPKYRVSRVAGFDVADAVLTVDPGVDFVGALKLVTGSARNSGEIYNFGAVCGACRCGAPRVKPLHIGAIRDIPVTVLASQLPQVDGDRTLTVWTYTQPGGWS